ncbi:hypothetical protein OIU77_025478 [Salix suchowensis]|uniref:PPM-type phosphatase domain-containing protein n=1 Tax=Salix suchowensis TaxID=1278906 RepID=A0ABQ9C0E6_9ROSI|nr:hypothetical protein OIU77_025478 [Salix suchowensis]
MIMGVRIILVTSYSTVDLASLLNFFPGDVPRVNGQLAVSRAFGDKSLKSHLRSDPDIQEADIDNRTEVLVLASDGLWKVMSNQEAVDFARRIKDPMKAAKQLTAEALKRESKDDISCVVVRFRGSSISGSAPLGAVLALIQAS